MQPKKRGPVWSSRQLREVFSLCDPEGTGLVSLDYLLRLGECYCAAGQDVSGILQQLDPARRGVLGFQDFCTGVRSLLRQDSGVQRMMMSPQRAVGVPAPTFVLTGTNPEPHSLNNDDADSAIGGSSSPDMNAKSQCSSMSDGENYECYGEGVDLELDADPPTPVISSNGPTSLPLGRNTWLRTSLRRTPPSNQETSPNKRWGSFRHSGKRIGSNALASSSFNSSGRSSTCDPADDMYSDVSLEEDVLDLNHKVQMLQQQMTVLADNQTSTDDRYTRAKQDSAALQARVHMLEEQLREAELRAEDRLADEQKRHRELMTRVEREKQLQIENCSIRLQTLEVEGATMREESTRLRIQVDRLRIEKENAQEKLEEAESEVTRLRSETVNVREMERRLKEEAARKIAANSQLVEDLSREVERLRVRGSEVNGLQGHDQAVDDDLTSRLVDLQKEVISLRQQNKSLEESNEELQAQMLSRSLEEGRHLLTGTSLAAEFEAMSHGELRDIAQEEISTEKMRTALKEQQEVNSQLRCYIDGILLNIVENYPQLLEVKRNHM